MSYISLAGTAADPPHAPAALEGIGTQPGRSHTSQAEAIERDQLLDRLRHLRKILPVFAEEMASARREAARLRVKNSRLLEQVGRLELELAQRTPTSTSRSCAKASPPPSSAPQHIAKASLSWASQQGASHLRARG